jgi:hypothetical protein
VVPLVPPLPGAAGRAASGALSEKYFVELVAGILGRNTGQLAAPICCQKLYALNSEYKAFIKKHGPSLVVDDKNGATRADALNF